MSEVRIVEVGPRDGLQNISLKIPREMKIRLIRSLKKAGLKEIEAGAFVSPKWVPQMEDSFEVIGALEDKEGLWALVPNHKGWESFLQSGLKNAAFFTAGSDSFCMRNTNRSFADSIMEFRPLLKEARQHGCKIRLYISTVFFCPYEGKIPSSRLEEVFSEVAQLEFDDVSLGDTIGKATASDVKRICSLARSFFAIEKLSCHFHDTYGTALANVAVALEQGITSFDSSASGLGGCPYAPGASGNLSTEDLIYFLHNEGIFTGVDLDLLIAATEEIDGHMNRKTRSKVKQAILSQRV